MTAFLCHCLSSSSDKTSSLLFCRLVVCGLTSKKVDLASEDDPLMLDIAGFDSNIIGVLHTFVNDEW